MTTDSLSLLAGARARAGAAACRLAAIAAAMIFVLAAGAGAARATGSPYAPVDRPGPALEVPHSSLATSVKCTSSVRSGGREPVLLVPGTDLSPAPNFAWNYERAFTALGLPWCTVELPQDATGDIQVAGEYVVYAIRHLYDISHHKVQILGFSQGGMVPRWALRFWPDTRKMVDDDIGLDASNHGTVTSDYCSATSPCPRAYWQQRDIAKFIAALNSRQETFAGISYTEIYSNKDEIVVPNSGPGASSSSVHGNQGDISNVMVQSICPADTSDHLAMGSYDAVGYALVMDALTHRGPGDPARISQSVCAQPYMQGVDPATFAANYAAYLAFVGQAAARAQNVSAEPPLRCYVFDAGCAGAARRTQTRHR